MIKKHEVISITQDVAQKYAGIIGDIPKQFPDELDERARPAMSFIMTSMSIVAAISEAFKRMEELEEKEEK